MTGPAIAVGANVYLWTQKAQNDLLVDSLEPLAREFAANDRTIRFWFDRFDARGPHLVVLFQAPAPAHESVAQRLAEVLSQFLVGHGTASGVSRSEIEHRHAACKGAILCDLDAQPGFAPENSWELFRQRAEDYPYRITARFPPSHARAFWEVIPDLCHWSVRQLAADPERGAPRTGLEFVAALDLHLFASGLDVEGFWRFYAGTLMFNVPARLASDPAEFLAALPKVVGEHNRSVFDRVWRSSQLTPCSWPRLGELIDLAAVPHTAGFQQPWRPLREVVHWALKYLGVSVRAEIPLILYAWHRHVAH
jgi:Lantibiotic biosynthesis dehydratase C-term